MILLEETQITIGVGAVITIIATVISAAVVFSWLHFKQNNKHETLCNDLDKKMIKQNHEIEKLKDKVSSHQNTIERFTSLMFDKAAESMKNNNNSSEK